MGLRDKNIVLADLDGTEFEIPRKEASRVCLTDEDLDFGEDIPEDAAELELDGGEE